MKTQPCSLLLLFMLSFLVKTVAQAPKVTTVFPFAQTVSTSANSIISATFDVPVDPASVSSSTFRIFGRWSGPAAGVFSFTNNNMTVLFSPAEPFFAGEWVTVQLSKGIKSTTGENLEKPYAWNYWIAASPGTLHQKLIETIELRLPGETHLQTYGAYAGDMNNDGLSDLIAVNESSDDLRILMNDGQGFYPSFTVYDTGNGKTPSPSEGGDFNNDGEIDMVVTTAWDNEVRVLTGDGQGNFSSMDIYYTPNGIRGIAVGDFNGDGWDDMLATKRLSGDIAVFMNDGDGTFTQSGMNLPGQDEAVCAMSDANNDGILDIFFGSFNSQSTGVLLGDGAGNFTLSGTAPVQGKPWMLGCGDMNGDGNADIVSVNYISNKVAVIFGDGQGGLGQVVHYTPPNYVFPVAVDLGDIDGDGDLDVVSSCYTSSNFTVFENNGLGQLSIATTLNSPEAASCAILHDRDNDGDLDITGTDEEADVILLFDNFDSTTNVSVEKIAEDFHLAISPNPAGENVTISYRLPKMAVVSLTLHDISGKRIELLDKKVQAAGNNSFQWVVPPNAEPGVYLIILNLAGTEVSKKLSVVK